MTIGEIEALPGFRRRFAVSPVAGRVTAAVEDDYHCMAVTLHHDGEKVTGVGAIMDRAPWTTCPGAPAVLEATFTGVALADVAARGEKQANCTHLYDLAVLAAAHAGDSTPTRFDILVCDPVDGCVVAEIRRDGALVHRIGHRDDIVTAPSAIAGTSLFKLRGWIETLMEPEREAARLLQWGAILAHGRIIPMERQSDASRMPPNCYTFQPDNKAVAKRIGKIIDFGAGSPEPLDHFDGASFGFRTLR
ncbi:DUF2889 domain-containing protein [Sphingomonas sp. LaA6.9]|uniref:DUF2889 domain-containing protein n=1 Tax=Sphingomonas sp. LaA6.9 TaxID=2919914 RepID=UPI001F4FB3F1|nr:DUF2889 domain-containing protein [Sphingomonas sp. LaA6.9]MCJ8156023.1 DUF2889 domain-containing protein [Sphingomonas sp. LaA6.9]